MTSLLAVGGSRTLVCSSSSIDNLGDKWPPHARHSRPSSNVIVLPQLTEDQADFKPENLAAAISAGLSKAQKAAAPEKNDNEREHSSKSGADGGTSESSAEEVDLPTSSPYKQEVDERMSRFIKPTGSDVEQSPLAKPPPPPPPDTADSSNAATRTTAGSTSEKTRDAVSSKKSDSTVAKVTDGGGGAPSPTKSKSKIRVEKMPSLTGTTRYQKPSHTARLNCLSQTEVALREAAKQEEILALESTAASAPPTSTAMRSGRPSIAPEKGQQKASKCCVLL